MSRTEGQGPRSGQRLRHAAPIETAALSALVRERFSSEASLPVLADREARQFGRDVLGGLWTLVDRFDSGERRYFVWCRNEAPGRLLTAREELVLFRAASGDGDRAVAMEFGCSPSTVATHRLRAMSKLGVESRTVLAQILAGLAARDE